VLTATLQDPGNGPLHAAVMNDNWETAELLLSKGADVHAKNNSGRTPLHTCAVFNSKLSAVVILDKYKGDTNVKNKGGCTPLHEAAINNSREMATILLDRNAFVNAKDKVVCLIPTAPFYLFDLHL
jgi:ankyrin repeat protein